MKTMTTTAQHLRGKDDLDNGDNSGCGHAEKTMTTAVGTPAVTGSPTQRDDDGKARQTT